MWRRVVVANYFVPREVDQLTFATSFEPGTLQRKLTLRLGLFRGIDPNNFNFVRINLQFIIKRMFFNLGKSFTLRFGLWLLSFL